jgi:hypothetical protein
MIEWSAAMVAAHDPLHDFTAFEVTEWSDEALVGSIPPVPPTAESHQNVKKILSLLSQEILVTRGPFLIQAGRQDSGLDKSGEAVGQNIASNTQVLLKIVKSLDPQESVSEDQDRPLVADQLGGVGDRTLEVLETLAGRHRGPL